MPANDAFGKTSKLGRGLSGLLSKQVRVDADLENTIEIQTSAPSIRFVHLSTLRASPFQARRAFPEATLNDLAASIRAAGIMQPILVRPIAQGEGSGGGSDARRTAYEIIAGERRWRAAKIAGLESIPVIVRELDDAAAAEWGLIENVQREDLSPMDRAAAFRHLAERFGMTHAAIAERVGVDRTTVTQLIRLTELEPEIQTLVGPSQEGSTEGRLTAGHAKAILSHPAGPGRIALAQRAAAEGWSVRRTERMATKGEEGASPLAREALLAGRTEAGWDQGPPAEREAALTELEVQLGDFLGTKVRVWTDRSGAKGRLTVEFYSLDHFDGLMQKLGFVMK